jgi:hypothetical protein
MDGALRSVTVRPLVSPAGGDGGGQGPSILFIDTRQSGNRRLGNAACHPTPTSSPHLIAGQIRTGTF